MASAAALGAVGRGFKSLCSDLTAVGQFVLPLYFFVRKSMFLSYIFWDPPRVAFTIPFIDHPIVWYSLFFAGGFFSGYLIAAKLLCSFLKPTRENASKTAFTFLDHLAWYVFIGMLVGARLGHVFFYEWHYYRAHPLEILFTWEGGLSSHGGGIGLILGVLLFWSKPQNRLKEVSFKKLLDILAVASAFVAGAIRLGNFCNQEILGRPSDLPFAVWFGTPADPGSQQPCHPVQLYEALFYFATCIVLYRLSGRFKAGIIAGWFFITTFTFRFFIEFLKLPQGIYDSSCLINMGQLLSLPFIALGFYLLIRKELIPK